MMWFCRSCCFVMAFSVRSLRAWFSVAVVVGVDDFLSNSSFWLYRLVHCLFCFKTSIFSAVWASIISTSVLLRIEVRTNTPKFAVIRKHVLNLVQNWFKTTHKIRSSFFQTALYESLSRICSGIPSFSSTKYRMPSASPSGSSGSSAFLAFCRASKRCCARALIDFHARRKLLTIPSKIQNL